MVVAGKEVKLTSPAMSVEDIVNNVQASYQKSSTQTTTIAEILPEKTTEVEVDKTPGSGPQVNSQFNTDHFFKPQLSDTKALEPGNTSVYNFFATRGSTVSVEEISDVTQEAEFWMSVNDPQRAIEILEPQAEVEHPESPVPWLYLLDLYKAVQTKINMMR